MRVMWMLKSLVWNETIARRRLVTSLWHCEGSPSLVLGKNNDMHVMWMIPVTSLLQVLEKLQGRLELLGQEFLTKKEKHLTLKQQVYKHEPPAASDFDPERSGLNPVRWRAPRRDLLQVGFWCGCWFTAWRATGPGAVQTVPPMKQLHPMQQVVRRSCCEEGGLCEALTQMQGPTWTTVSWRRDLAPPSCVLLGVIIAGSETRSTRKPQPGSHAKPRGPSPLQPPLSSPSHSSCLSFPGLVLLCCPLPHHCPLLSHPQTVPKWQWAGEDHR